MLRQTITTSTTGSKQGTPERFDSSPSPVVAMRALQFTGVGETSEQCLCGWVISFGVVWHEETIVTENGFGHALEVQDAFAQCRDSVDCRTSHSCSRS